MPPDADSIQLYLVRHADAGDPQAWAGNDDDRPLSDKGRRQSERLGRFLKAIDFQTEAVVSSPKSRALDTARIVAHRLGAEVKVDERLGASVSLRRLEEIMSDLGARRPMLVGHDPDFSALVAMLCGASRVPMKKGALCRIDVQPPLQPGGGVLRWLIPPGLLREGED